MWTKYLLPIFSALGLVLGIIAVFIGRQTPPTPPIPFSPPSPPFAHFVAGEGIVEAESLDIWIGTPITEIVEKVFVEPGDLVEKGAPLFQLNSDKLVGQLVEAQALQAVAEAEYQRQLDLPRPEDVVPVEARVKIAQATFIDKWKQYELVDKLENPKAISRDEYNQRKYGAIAAKYSLDEAEAELDLILAGAWRQDLEIKRKEVKAARAKTDLVRVDIDRSLIRAPIDGCVFRVNIAPGELAQAMETSDPLILFGAIDPLHIRVNIDEEEVWRVIPGEEGIAYIRGNSSLHVPLKFVRLDPYLVPKRALTGATSEQIDTRVLQITFEFERDELPIYPGMLMDVFLKARPSRIASAGEES